MKLNSTQYRAALYMRLSRDDAKNNESSSITTQRKMLRFYAEENSFVIFDEYIDDGFTGTNFDRPSFNRMIQDIEDKKINLVITKDLSRLGRDYITTGQYTEIYFPSKDVRYIAINDAYDSESPYNDIAPFKNVINELLARDTSKKIRSAFLTKMQDGCFIGNFAPYGYQKDEANKNHLLIDPVSAANVKKIFELAEGGCKASEIANIFNNNKIPTPAMYRCLRYPHLNIDDYSDRKEWTATSIRKMLGNVIYLGNMAQGKTTKVSFKSHITIANQKKDWIVINNTHEAIISKETFHMVSCLASSRICAKQGKFSNIFSGIAKCKDCGSNMSTVASRKKGAVYNLACGRYKLHGCTECSNHFIDYEDFYNIVLKAIGEQINISENEKIQLLETLENREKIQAKDIYEQKELENLRKRNRELDGLIEKLYEDNFSHVISDDRFHKLLNKYEADSVKISEQINNIISSQEYKKQTELTTTQSYERFTSLIAEYTDIKVLTVEILYKLIDRIEISQGLYVKTSSGKQKQQRIQIYFRFIGNAITRQYYIDK